MQRKPVLAAASLILLAAIACAGAATPGNLSNAGETSGEDLFRSLGCVGCHVEGAGEAAPSLEGVFGSEVMLDSGETIVADEAYTRESILSPEARLVSGYQPIMPSFRGRLSEAELDALVGYIRSLAD